MSRFVFESNRAAVTQAQERALERELRTRIGPAWLAEATRRTPVDTGHLVSTLRPVVEGLTLTLGASADYALAVHEDLDPTTGKPRKRYRVGGPKFIESPLREHSEAWVGQLTRALRDAL